MQIRAFGKACGGNRSAVARREPSNAVPSNQEIAMTLFREVRCAARPMRAVAR
jgi:hypothetical protein